MDVLEMVRTKVKEISDKAGPPSEMLNSAKSAIVHGLDGASKFVNDKTHGKYSSAINTSVGKAKDLLGQHPEQPKPPENPDQQDQPE